MSKVAQALNIDAKNIRFSSACVYRLNDIIRGKEPLGSLKDTGNGHWKLTVPSDKLFSCSSNRTIVIE